jgi:hypothetical protein
MMHVRSNLKRKGVERSRDDADAREDLGQKAEIGVLAALFQHVESRAGE